MYDLTSSSQLRRELLLSSLFGVCLAGGEVGLGEVEWGVGGAKGAVLRHREGLGPSHKKWSWDLNPRLYCCRPVFSITMQSEPFPHFQPLIALAYSLRQWVSGQPPGVSLGRAGAVDSHSEAGVYQ